MNNCFKDVKNSKKSKIKLILSQVSVFILFLFVWELLARLKIIDEFLFSKPTTIFSLLVQYIKSREIFIHIGISLYETILGIVIGSGLGILIAILLWSSKKVSDLLEPFLVVLNALPKTALAPIMIIWAGTGVSGIVVVAISILLIITIISTCNYFINVDEEKIKMLLSFKATRFQLFTKLIFPYNLVNIINVIKINIGMAWVGVIVGEFLVSRAGTGC